MGTYSTFIHGVTAPDGTESPGEPDIERRFDAQDENDAAKLACAAYLHEKNGKLPAGASVRVLVLQHRNTHPPQEPNQWTFDLDVWGRATATVH